MSMFIGEALAGDGNEIAHIDLLIGSKDGPGRRGVRQRPGPAERRPFEPAGRADPESRRRAGHRDDHEGDHQGREAGRADVRPRPGRRGQGRGRQRGRRRASRRAMPRTWSIVCGVFIHWLASDDKKIYDYNYKATMDAIANAMHGKPTVDEMVAGKDKAAASVQGVLALRLPRVRRAERRESLCSTAAARSQRECASQALGSGHHAEACLIQLDL